jgi:hypothetical protein
VVLVAGLSSSGRSGAVDAVDTAALGYEPADVVRFSYRGGRVPAADAGSGEGATTHPLAGLAGTDYGAPDTEADLRRSGARLLALLQQVADAVPGVPIDVIAHSQGGLVARLAVEQGTAAGGLPAGLSRVITLGTPHGGADLATAAVAVGGDDEGAWALAEATRRLGLELDPAAPSIAQMAETSELIAELGGTDPPATVELRSIAAAGDLVVPVPRTVWPGADHVVVSVPGVDDHTTLPGSAAAQREIALALAGAPPTCESPLDTLTDQLGGELVSWVQDLAGAGLSGAAHLG